MSGPFSLGIDYGTLSVRTVVVDMTDGREVSSAVYEYPHGVMDRALPDGTPLPDGFALAHPQDYLDGLTDTVRRALAASGVNGGEIIGIGVDATSASLIPLDENLAPLCLDQRYACHPHSYIKLWKHHGAEPQAKRLRQTALERGEDWLSLCGGDIRCESLLPKIVETAQKDPEVYDAAAVFVEIGDWLVSHLTGKPVRSLQMAGSNCFYHLEKGYPSEEFLKAAFPHLPPVTRKMTGTLVPVGSSAGGLAPEVAEALGLPAGILVSASHIDAHTAALGCGASQEGDLTAVLGTSACYLLNSASPNGAPGIYSTFWEANAPGWYGLEGGQSAVGDGLAWFVEQCVPAAVTREAAERGLSVHTLLTEKATGLAPGESGLLALDWWNGVRSPLMDPTLRGVVVGLSLHTRPEELYRAFLEAICFGARRIIDCCETAGHPVKRIFAAGGIAAKNPLMMQLLADICGRPVRVCASAQTCALGSAILGASAARPGTFSQLIGQMASPVVSIYQPQPEAVKVYEDLYRQYLDLSEFLCRPQSPLRQISSLKKDCL